MLVRGQRELGAAAIALLSLGLPGCGGGAALLHPAHALAQGKVSAGAGLSHAFVLGPAGGTSEPGPGAPGPAGTVESRFVEDAVARAAMPRGLAPWVGARAGLGATSDAGLTYTGRAARVDARHAFEDGSVAISVGLGGSALLFHPRQGPPDAGGAPSTAGRFAGHSGALATTGFGADLPVLVGWRSAASIVEVWAGARAGAERLHGELNLASPGTATGAPEVEQRATVSATHWYAGGLVGFGVGLSPIWVRLELSVGWAALSGSAEVPSSAGAPSRVSTSLTGLQVAPAAAVLGKF